MEKHPLLLDWKTQHGICPQLDLRVSASLMQIPTIYSMAKTVTTKSRTEKQRTEKVPGD